MSNTKIFLSKLISKLINANIAEVGTRESLAQKYLIGTGIEIGALHKPLIISSKCRINYVDHKSLSENRNRYPELINEEIVETNIIDDGFILDKIENNSLDFIIANHALEHSPDPFGTLCIWRSKIKTDGIIYAAVPLAQSCFDKGRPITTLRHLITDHNNFLILKNKDVLQSTMDHVWEFICISDKNIRIINNMDPTSLEDKKEHLHRLSTMLGKELLTTEKYSDIISAHVNTINRIYDIHYHTFNEKSYRLFLSDFCKKNKCKLEDVVNIGNNECVGIIRKIS